MVILMADEKPINAMYGTKMKLDLNKLRNNSKEEETAEEVVETVETKAVEPVEEVVETTQEETVEETVEEVVEEPEEEVVEEPVEEVPEEEVAEEIEEVPEEEVVEEAAEEEVPEEEAPEEPVEETTEETSDKDDISKKLDDLKAKLKEKESKLSNQSSELNYLTNKIIPKLKSENKELNKLKNELSNALESSTKKYFDQLDINADLSDKLGKIGAEGAVNKVRTDKLESELASIKDKYEAKIDEYKQKLNSVDMSELTDLKEENKNLKSEISDLNDELDKTKEENANLSNEINDLRQKLIEIGDYKEEVDAKTKATISKLEEENSSLKTDLKIKQSSYDKLSNDSNKTISDLRKEVARLEEALEKESNKGLFNRFK